MLRCQLKANLTVALYDFLFLSGIYKNSYLLIYLHALGHLRMTYNVLKGTLHLHLTLINML